jgi:hydroxymethylbilane synthase
MTPAAGQGALVLQGRAGDRASRAAGASVADPRALLELTAERAVVAALEASCATPIGVHARLGGERLVLDAFVGLPDGSEWIRDRVEADAGEAAALGGEAAERLLAAGAREILERAEQMAGHP